MERIDGLKSNEVRRDFQILNIDSLKPKQKKVDLEYHYVVPWEIVEDDNQAPWGGLETLPVKRIRETNHHNRD